MLKENIGKTCVRFLSVANRFTPVWADTKLTTIWSSKFLRYGTHFTPSHLLFSLKLNVENICGKFDRNKLTDLSKQMKHINHLLNHSWSRWRSEYVQSLISNTKRFYGKQTVSYLVLAMLLMFTRKSNLGNNGFYDE